jgi:protein SCO1
VKALLFALLASVALVVEAAAETPTSLYNMKAELTDQAGQPRGFDLYRGKHVLVTMFYASCPMTCPLLIDTLRAVEHSVPFEERKDLRVLLISIDPEHDTPAALARLMQERHLDGARWTLVQADQRTVTKLAAMLNVQYRKLPNGGFNHSSVITLLSPSGEIAAQSTMLGKADETLINAIMRAR